MTVTTTACAPARHMHHNDDPLVQYAAAAAELLPKLARITAHKHDTVRSLTRAAVALRSMASPPSPGK